MLVSTLRLCRVSSIIALYLLNVLPASHGASVGVVKLDGEGDPELEQIVNIEAENGESIAFLSKFGYLPESDGKSYLLTSNGVSSALKKMQKYGGLEETGVLDNATLKLMKTPRCGVPDVIDGMTGEDGDVLESLTIREWEEEEEEEEDDDKDGYYPSKRRRKRYALQGSRWKKRRLSYKVGRYPSRLSRAEVDADVLKAFNMWAKASGLTFVRKYSGGVDIEIRFENYYHGDEDSFDGPGGVVAHAFFPEFGGDAHFDNGEDWTVNKYSGVSLLQSVAHELGHSLGLLHSSESGAMMSPYHKGWKPNLSLGTDDIRAVRRLYSNQVSTRTNNNNRRPKNYYYRY